MPNLIDAAQQLARPSAFVHVHQKRCLCESNDETPCELCADVCPVQAITIQRKQSASEPWGSYGATEAADVAGPHLDDEACVQCGRCITACPTGALLPLSPWDDNSVLDRVAQAGSAAAQARAQALARRAQESATSREQLRDADDAPDESCAPSVLPATMGFACERTAKTLRLDASRTVTLPCLAWLDEALLFHAACCGAQRVVLLAHECSACDLASAAAPAERVAREAQRIADVAGLDARMLYDTTDSAEGVRASLDAEITGAPSRRGLFAQARSSLIDAATNAASAQVEALTGTQKSAGRQPEPDVRRWKLLDDFHARSRADAATIVPRTLAPRVDIDVERCSGCALCAAFCPTGALRKAGKASGGGTLLEFDAALCRDCGVCTSTCRYQAISCEETLTVAELFALEPHELCLPKRRVLPARR